MEKILIYAGAISVLTIILLWATKNWKAIPQARRFYETAAAIRIAWAQWKKQKRKQALHQNH